MTGVDDGVHSLRLGVDTRDWWWPGYNGGGRKGSRGKEARE